MPSTVLTYGTFDLFHIGHLRLIERAQAFGDRLIVGVSTDEFNQRKGKASFVSFADRLSIVSAIKGVDFAFAENDWAQKPDDIRDHGVDLLVMGSDWEGKFDSLSPLCRVEYLPRTDGVSSTQLRHMVRALDPTHIADLKMAADTLSAVVSHYVDLS